MFFIISAVVRMISKCPSAGFNYTTKWSRNVELGNSTKLIKKLNLFLIKQLFSKINLRSQYRFISWPIYRCVRTSLWSLVKKFTITTWRLRNLNDIDAWIFCKKWRLIKHGHGQHRDRCAAAAKLARGTRRRNFRRSKSNK